MSTIASLIRAHERNAANLYVAPASNRESTPGRYDRTASQKSPALDRRQIRDAAQGAATKFPELVGMDLSGIQDYEDLQNLLDEVRNPGVETPDVPEVELPPIQTPEFPEIPPSPFPVDHHRLSVLHDGRLSISADSGATWRFVSASPSAPVGFAVPPGSPVLIATADAVYRSQDLGTWTPVALPSPSETEIYIENGDFESYTAGWTLVSGDSPRTQSTTNPPQREGSKSYLTRDWVILGSGEFEIEQSLILGQDVVGAVTAGAEIHVRADVYVREHASVGIFARIDLPEYPVSTGKSVSAGTTANWGTAPDGRSLDLAFISGNPSGLSAGTNGSDGRRVLHLRYSDTGEVYEGPVSLRIIDIDRFEEVRIPKSRVLSYSSATDSGIAFSHTSTALLIKTTRDNVSADVVLNSGVIDLDFRLNASGINIALSFAEESYRVVAEAVEKDAWQQLELTVPAEWADKQILVGVKASGSPADAYIDNVRAFLGAGVVDPAISAVARHGTAASVIDKDRLIRIGPDGAAAEQQKYPTEASEIAFTAEGQPYALCKFGVMTPGGRIVGGGGDPFTSLVGGDFRFLAVRASGSLCAVDDTDERTITTLSQVAPGSSIHYSAALMRFIAVSPAGAVIASQDGAICSNMPAIPIKTQQPGMRILTAPSGRLYCYAPGWSAIAFLEPGSPTWKVSGRFPAPIISIEIG